MRKFYSVLTIVKNAENNIQDTILSVLGQSCKDFEYIVVDGNSNDKTLSIINKFENDIDKIISKKDSGIYYAMNYGSDISTGHYIIYMNAGDTFASSHTLKNVKDKILKLKKLPDVVYGDVILKDADILKNQKAFDLKDLYKGMCFCHQSTFVKNELTFFNTNYKLAADYDLFLRLYNKSYLFYYVSIPISIYDTNGVSNSLKAFIEQFKINLLNSFSFRSLKYYLPRIIYNYLKNVF